MKRVIILAHAEARRRAYAEIDASPDGRVVTFSEPTRSTAQNSRLWACLGDIAKQVVWHGRKLDAESWKHVFSSSLRKLDVVPNVDGTGFVALGLSTSRMTKAELSDLLELIAAFGVQHGVIWSESGDGF